MLMDMYIAFKTTKEVKKGEELLWSYKYPGCFTGKQGRFLFPNNNPDEQWLDGNIQEYISEEERNAMAVRDGEDLKTRGMYKFKLDLDGEEDYFSDDPSVGSREFIIFNFVHGVAK